MPIKAILDRLAYNAYKIELKGESMRRKRSILERKSEAVTEEKSHPETLSRHWLNTPDAGRIHVSFTM